MQPVCFSELLKRAQLFLLPLFLLKTIQTPKHAFPDTLGELSFCDLHTNLKGMPFSFSSTLRKLLGLFSLPTQLFTFSNTNKMFLSFLSSPFLNYFINKIKNSQEGTPDSPVATWLYHFLAPWPETNCLIFLSCNTSCNTHFIGFH